MFEPVLPHRQDFSIPENIIYYLIKNPSNLIVYKKIIQTCKYFFYQNSIIVVVKYVYNRDNELWMANFFDEEARNALTRTSLGDFANKLPLALEIRGKRFPKIWITATLNILGPQKNLTSKLLEKVYRCNLRGLFLFCQIITYEEYLILVSSKLIALFSFRNTLIKYENGNVVSLDEILKELPNVENFRFIVPDDSVVSTDALERLSKLPYFEELKYFKMYNLPEPFDFTMFNDFVKKQKRTDFFLTFSKQLSPETKEQIRNVHSALRKSLSEDQRFFIQFN